MAELALALSIVSLIKLSNTVLTSCADYVGKVKNAPRDINKIINEVSGLEFILKRLSKLASPSSEFEVDHSSEGNDSQLMVSDSPLTSLRALQQLQTGGPFNGCKEVLVEISNKLEKVSSTGSMQRRLILWPFESGKVEKLLSTLEKHKTTFLLALTGDLHDRGKEHGHAIAHIGSQIEDLKIREERRAIEEWLRSGGADPSTNHNAACKKHAAGTGDWLLTLDTFQSWKDSDGEILWLNGISGSGKTVLSSSVVEYLRQNQLQGNLLQRPARVAYFYFDFSDQAKQNAHGCIQSLVKQLFDQSEKIPKEARSLYNDCKDGRPSLERLIEVLISMLSNSSSTSIVIDALDECKAEEGEDERRIIYEVLTEIKCNAKGSYRIFIASRPELDIQREITAIGVAEVNVESALVDQDIRAYIRGLLPKESHFKKWPEGVKKQIEDTLVSKSDGMFRWVACQLDSLRKCVKPANALRQLQNLPRTLEDTYTRILQKVPPENEREFRTILMLLAFSARPMTIQEVAEATAVDLESHLFSPDERFGDAYDMLSICSSLVSLTELGADSMLRKEKKTQLNWENDVKVIQFAHFSVKEYVLSERERNSIPESLFVNESLSQKLLAEMCLIYLLDFNGGELATDVNHNQFPFLAYAALHWTSHLTLVSEDDREGVSRLLLRLFDLEHPESLMNYLNLYNPVSIWNAIERRHIDKEPTRTINFGTKYRNKADFQTPLYYANLYGLDSVVEALFGRMTGPLSQKADELGSALEAAASSGNDEFVERLLAEGANPNAKFGTQFHRPIQAAANSGRSSIVKLLLSAGADVSPASYGGEHGTALHAAASRGSTECIEALLSAEHELDYLATGIGHNGTALAVAASKGHDKAVECLINNGANPTLHSSRYNYPLNRACENCSITSVKALLNAGADANGVAGRPPLHDAAERGDVSIMKMLLEYGADIDAPGGTYGTPLKAAIQSRVPAVFNFMIDHGADINAKGSTTKYPVDQAIFGGNLEAADKLLELQAKVSGEALIEAVDYPTKEYLVPELLRRGAGPNTEHSHQGNVLQLAVSKGCQEATISALLEAGADVNAVEGEYGTAIQAAVDRKEENIIRLLLEHGANFNLPACGKFGNPLQIAVQNKSEAITQLLLELGANINALGGVYGSIIQVAAASGNETLVAHLLNKHVDVNAVGGEYGTALRAAIAMEHEPIVKLLLDAGSQIDIKATSFHSTKANKWTNNTFESTLEVATASCNTSIFQLLLDHGMILSPENLEAALVQAVVAIGSENKLKMLNLLVSKGADIKKYGGKALLFACESSGEIEVVQTLISLGVPLNWSWNGGNGSALMNAIDRDHNDFVLALLDAGADVNLAAGRSGTALIQAIQKGNKAIALELLDRGADPNIKAGSDGTALIVSVKKGDEEMFYELLKRGADVNLTHGNYGTALHAALQQNYYHIAHELLDRGADPSAPGVHASPLISASGYAKPGQAEFIKRLLTLGVDLEVYDVKRPEDKIFWNRWIFNALHNAARAGNETIANILLDAGANINSVGGTCGTALQAAVRERHEGMVKLLLARGADIDLVGGEYGTPLQDAAVRGRIALVEFLLAKGADVNVEGGEYGTALQAACTTSSKLKIVSELLARGAKVNTSCGQYGNPLQAAVHHGDAKIVETLLECGADVNFPGGQYGFPLQAAVSSHCCDPENLEILHLLLDKGADVNAEGGEFGTALQAAAYHHREYVEILLEHGAEKAIKGGKYGSALGAAREKGFNRVVKLLS